MLNSNKIKLGILTLSTAVLATFAIPATHSHALSSSTNINDILQQYIGNQGQVVTPSTTQPTQSSAPTQVQPTNTATTASQSSVALADQIIKTGEKYLGTPYQFGAPSGQTRTFDCSSFVQYVFKKNGISLPRNSRQQSTVGTSVSKSNLQKGDLMFFKTAHSGGRIAHVGIYAGNNKILHTWGPGGVRYDSLNAGWLKQGFVGAKRVIK